MAMWVTVFSRTCQLRLLICLKTCLCINMLNTVGQRGSIISSIARHIWWSGFICHFWDLKFYTASVSNTTEFFLTSRPTIRANLTVTWCVNLDRLALIYQGHGTKRKFVSVLVYLHSGTKRSKATGIWYLFRSTASCYKYITKNVHLPAIHN